MPIPVLNVSEQEPAWACVLDISEAINPGHWLLVGGLAVQAHAQINGVYSRATVDVDMLLDILLSSTQVSSVVAVLETKGFKPIAPALKGGSFHRLKRSDGIIVDVLVADHLPKSRDRATRIGAWKTMSVPGGAQAIERKMTLNVASATRKAQIAIPDLLGMLVLKCAAYANDKREKERHLQDVALLASLITDAYSERGRMHGSDKKRIRCVAEVLADNLSPAWLVLRPDLRQKGQAALRLLAS